MNQRFQNEMPDMPLEVEVAKMAAFAASPPQNPQHACIHGGRRFKRRLNRSENKVLRACQQMLTPCHAACVRARVHDTTL